MFLAGIMDTLEPAFKDDPSKHTWIPAEGDLQTDFSTFLKPKEKSYFFYSLLRYITKVKERTEIEHEQLVYYRKAKFHIWRMFWLSWS